MISHKSVEIKVKESLIFVESKQNQEYVVSANRGLVFSASCKYGDSYAKTPQDAVDGCKSLIDNVVG